MDEALEIGRRGDRLLAKRRVGGRGRGDATSAVSVSRSPIRIATMPTSACSGREHAVAWTSCRRLRSPTRNVGCGRSPPRISIRRIDHAHDALAAALDDDRRIDRGDTTPAISSIGDVATQLEVERGRVREQPVRDSPRRRSPTTSTSREAVGDLAILVGDDHRDAERERTADDPRPPRDDGEDRSRRRGRPTASPARCRRCAHRRLTFADRTRAHFFLSAATSSSSDRTSRDRASGSFGS